MGKIEKITISIPDEILSFADTIAKKNHISRSKAITLCLKELADKQQVAEMIAGYEAMAEEQRQIAELATKVEHEVIPEWE